MDDFDNLVGKKSADTNTDSHNNSVAKDDKESQEDQGIPKNNSSQNEGSPQGNCSGRNEDKKSKKDKGPDVIVILKMNIFELFVDQIGDAYAAVKIKDYIEAIPINSNRFKDWIIKTCYDYEKQLQSNDFENERTIRILGDEGAAKYQTIIRLQAEEQRNERRLEIRVAGNVESDPIANEDGNVIYYDLCNKDGEIIRVTRNGWEIIKHGDPVFKHSRNQLPQQKPSKEYPSDILAQFLNLTNLPTEDKENRILAEVYIISLFLPPDIAKPILLPYGEQGSAKSTFQEFIKELVDLGDFTVSVEGENENQVASSAPAGVPESSPTFPSSRSDENCASDTNGEPDGEVGARASSCSALHNVSLSNEGLDEVKVSSITNFFYDDPNKPWTPLPEDDLNQSPCYPIIAIKQNYYYCILHPEVKNIHLKSIEHHIKYKDPEAHKSELLKSPQTYSWLADPTDR